MILISNLTAQISSFFAYFYAFYWKNVWTMIYKKHYILAILRVVIPIACFYTLDFQTDTVRNIKGKTSTKNLIEFQVPNYPRSLFLEPSEIIDALASGDEGNNIEVTFNIAKQKQKPKDDSRQTVEEVNKFIAFIFINISLFMFSRELNLELTTGIKELIISCGVEEETFWISHVMAIALDFSILITVGTFIFVLASTEEVLVDHEVTFIFCMSLLIGVSNTIAIIIPAIIAQKPTHTVWMSFILVILGPARAWLTSNIKPESNKESYYTKMIPLLYDSIPSAPTFEIYRLVLQKNYHAQWSSLSNDKPSSREIKTLVIKLLASSFMWAIASWYTYNTWNFSFHIAEPIWFFLKPSYWGIRRKSSYSDISTMTEPPTFEHHGRNFEPYIVCYQLEKSRQFLASKNYIIKPLDMVVSGDKVTSFLGEGRSGKTMLLRVLVGALKPSGGSLYVDGVDLVDGPSSNRKRIGYCPEKNAMYSEMTIYENMYFFSKLKRGNPDVEEDIHLALHNASLVDWANFTVDELDQQECRRLQIAISLMGRPQFLALDQPTKGLDYKNQTLMWDTLVRIRSQCGFVLATNCIAEAEILADTIAVMYRGNVLCLGSSVYLRKQFGMGYTLSIITSNENIVWGVDNFIRKHRIEAELILQKRNTISYCLGFPKTSEIIDICTKLENSSQSLNIQRMVLYSSSLEDVLLRVQEGTSQRDAVDESRLEITRSGNTGIANMRNLSHISVFMHHIIAVAIKKIKFYIYNDVQLIFSSLPSIFCMLLVAALIAGTSHHPIGVFISQNRSVVKTQALLIEKELSYDIMVLTVAAILLLPVTLTTPLTFPCAIHVTECWTSLKHLHFMAGMAPQTYWISSFFCDLFVAIFYCGLLSWILVVGTQMYCSVLYGIFEIFLTLISFAIFVIAACYYCSRYVSDALSLRVAFIFYSFLTGTFLTGFVTWLYPSIYNPFQMSKNQMYTDLALIPVAIVPPLGMMKNILKTVSRAYAYQVCCSYHQQLMYHVCANAAFNLSMGNRKGILYCCEQDCNEMCYSSGLEFNDDVDWDNLIMLFIGFILLLAAIAGDLDESPIMKRVENLYIVGNLVKYQKGEHRLPSVEIDNSVLEEQQRVQQVYERVMAGEAVDGLVINGVVMDPCEDSEFIGPVSIAVNKTEFFGIIGLPSSGKNEVLELAAGMHKSLIGNVVLNNIHLDSDTVEYTFQVGLCATTDPLIASLKAIDIMFLVARLRCVPSSNMVAECHYVADVVGVRRYLYHKIYNLSPGVKRRFSVAIALISNPKLVILQDCTEHICPTARLRMLQNLEEYCNLYNCSFLFSTHCLREYDTFCDRVGVMCLGVFTTVGVPAELKENSGVRTTIVVQLTEEQASQKNSFSLVNRGMKQLFPSCVIVEMRDAQLWYRIKAERIRWSILFTRMDILKEKLEFQDYLVNEASLGEIFLGYSRERKMVDFEEDRVMFYDKELPPNQSLFEPPAEGAN